MMRWFYKISLRLRSLFRKTRVEKELTDELRFHLEKLIEGKVAHGVTPEDARYAALRELGGMEQIKEECRDMRRVNYLENFLQDVRYGLRQLRRNAGFTVVAVLTLGLGIGANTAIFSVVDAVLLRPLPYRQPDHLVKIWGNFAGIGLPNNQNSISAPEFKDLESLNKSFTGVAAISGASANLGVGGTPQRVQAAVVSPSLFAILGAKAAFGRTFLPEEGEAGHENVVLLSYGLWRRGFGGEPGVVGSRLKINGASYAVVGVMPAGFQYPVDAEIWAPLAFKPNDLTPANRGNHGLEVLARIKPELSLQQAREDMKAVTKAVEDQNKDYPYAQFQFAFTLTPLLDEMVSDVQTALWILTGAVALVLLIACANVASLLLVRASAREREMAVRMAMGASRPRLIRQMLTESVLLSLLGGVAGLLIAHWGLRALIALTASILPRVAAASLSGTVLVFTMLISLGTGILFGLAPALHTSGEVKHESLKGGGRTSTAASVSQRLRHALIVAEIALSLVLLNGAGLLVKSFLRLQEVDGGFRPDHVLTMSLSLPEEKYSKPEQVRAFYRDVLDRVSKLPGVQATGAVSLLPLSGSGSSGTTTIDTQAVPPDAATPEADWRTVTPGYFRAMGIALVSGRYIDERDSDQSPPVAVVDETLARTYWPREDAVGKRLHRGGVSPTAPWATVVGVVRHVRYRTLEAQSRVEVYWPEAQNAAHSMSLAIRTSSDPHQLAVAVQKEVAAVDPEQPAYQIRTMDEVVEGSLVGRRLAMLLLSIFSGAALLLAAVGIYGIMAYWASQRSNEMGIRRALGAQKGDVLGLVVGQGVKLTLIGVGIGIIGALALTRSLSSLLYGVKPTDPPTFIAVSLILTAVALVASYIPARRATRVDPMVALRYE
ncbi:MAG: ABC transporter permease [Terriglobia bacterium]|jgi:putative ABC transport system permease protein